MVDQHITVEDGFEWEESVDFPEQSIFDKAARDTLDIFGGRVAEIEVTRSTMLLDTEDVRLRERDISISLVLHAGITHPMHKIAIKTPTKLIGVRREVVIKVHYPGMKWAALALDQATGRLESLFDDLRIEPTELRQVGLLRQHRRKRTVSPVSSLPVFLSFDHFSVLDSSGSIRLGERLRLEAESIGPGADELLQHSRMPIVLDYFRHNFGASQAEESKRTLVQQLTAASRWAGKDTEISEIVPQSTIAVITPARKHARFLQDVVLRDGRAKLLGPLAALDFNAAMALPSEDDRRAAHRAHYSALRIHAAAALENMTPGLDEPAVVPMRRAFANHADSTAMLRTTFAVYESALPALQALHRARSYCFTGEYTLADVQVSQRETAVPLFEAAREQVVDAVGRFFGRDQTISLFTDGRVDIVRGGVSGTAATVRDDDGRSRVAVPWSESVNSILALAHECTHAVHMDAKDGYPYLPSLLRESVARIAEFELLRNRNIDPDGYWALERWRSQFFRPMYQSAFEIRLRDGSVPRDPELMRDAYAALLQDTYGPAVTVHPDNGYEWVKARHLFRPFSLIEYATSFLIGALLHEYLDRDGEAQGVLNARTVDDFSALLNLDVTSPDTYHHVVLGLHGAATTPLMANSEVPT